MKPSTVIPTTERERRARSAARAAIAALALGALATAGGGRGIDTACIRDSSKGAGGTRVASRSASRDIATSPETACSAARLLLMATLRDIFAKTLAVSGSENAHFPDSQLNG